MSTRLDITTTATLRPSLLTETLESFHLGMLAGVNCRHIINIDLIGDEHYSAWDMVNVSKQYFDYVDYTINAQPHFAKAFLTVWNQVDTDYFLHLEDDWKLLKSIDLSDMIKTMELIPDLAILRLPFTDAKETEALQWNRYFPYNGSFMECPLEMRGGIGYSGHPSLIKRAWLKQVLPLLNADGCPEKQIKGHNPVMLNVLNQWRYGVWQKPLEKKAIVDIGRKWREDFGFIKNGAYGFTNWKRKNETDANA